MGKLLRRPFVVVHDPAHIFDPGAEFKRDHMSHTLSLACWTVGMVFRDTTDNWRYRVVEYRVHETSRQKLRHLSGTVELVPKHNSGSLERRKVDEVSENRDAL